MKSQAELYKIFMDEYVALTERTGFQVAPAAGTAESMDANWLIRPGVKVEPIPNWQPPPESDEDEVK